jgi:hypothetical protein
MSSGKRNFFRGVEKRACLDSDTGEDLAEEVRKYQLSDFL